MEKRTKYIKKLAILSLLAMLTLDMMPYFSYAVDYSEETQAEQQVDDTSSDLENHNTENNDLEEQELSLDEQDSDEQDLDEQDLDEQDAEESDTQIIKEEQEDEDSKGNNTETDNNETDHPSTLLEETPTYIMAKDSDFSGTSNGTFRYIGTDDYVEIPHVIKGVNVTSYAYMFQRTSVKGVKSTNKKVTNMVGMFDSMETDILDISELDTSNVTEMTSMFHEIVRDDIKLHTIIGLDKINTSKVKNMSSMFYRTRLKDIDVSNFNTENLESMANMFSDVSVKELDLRSFDTSNVINMNGLFYNSKKLNIIKGVENFKTSNVAYMGEMFYGVPVTELNLSNWDTRKVTSMTRMFYGTTRVKTLDISNFDTSNVTSMDNMFRGSQATTIKGLENFNTSKVKNMTAMFASTQAREIDVSSFDTSKITSMLSMFEGTSNTTEIKGLESFDTSNVTNMSRMFLNSGATELNLSSFNTSRVTDMDNMFNNSKATKLDLSSFNTEKVTTMENMFEYAQAKEIEVTSFDTTYVGNMDNMFHGSYVNQLDISSFDMRGVNKTTNMFQDSAIKTIVAKTQEDKNKIEDTGGFPTSATISIKYRLASDEDFIGTVNGSYRYIGKEDYVEVPHTIRGTKLTSYKRMFENTNVKGVVSTNKNIKDMSEMFKGNTSSELDVSAMDTTSVTDMSGMFDGLQVRHLDLRNFNTVNVTDISRMFKDTQLEEIDLGSFNLSKVTSSDDLFKNTKATKGYARTQEDLEKINKSKNKPNTLKFTIWGITVTPKPADWTNGFVNLEVESLSGNNQIKDTEFVNNHGENIIGNMGYKMDKLSGYSGTKVTLTKGVTVPEWGVSDATRVKTVKGETSLHTMWGLNTKDYMGKMVTHTVYVKNNSEYNLEIQYNGIHGVDAPSHVLKPWFSGRIKHTGIIRHTHEFVQIQVRSLHDVDATFYGHKIELGDEMTDYTPPLETTVDEGVFPIYNNGTYIFRATDVNGQSRIVSHTVDNIDREKPTATIKPSTTGFTSQDVTLYVNAEDKLSGIDRIEHPDGTVVKSDHSEFKATENKKYTFKVYDKAGNEESVSYTVTNIDRSIPKLTATLDNTQWTRDPVNITVKSEDSLSGLIDIELLDSHLEGRNLFSKKQGFKGFISGTGKEAPPDAENWTSGFINVKNLDLKHNDLYYSVNVKVQHKQENFRFLWTGISFYDKDKKFIKRQVYNEPYVDNGTEQYKEFNLNNIIEEDVHYIRVGSRYLEEGKANLVLVPKDYVVTNLYDKEKSSIGYISNTGEFEVPDAKNRTSAYIDIEDFKGTGLEYNIKITIDKEGYTSSSWTGLALYDKNKNFIERVTFQEPNVPIGTTQELSYKIDKYLGEEVKYIRIGSRYLEDGEAELRMGKDITPYTPAPEDIKLINNSKTYPVIANGNYTFKATYNNGATSETSVNVTNIDLDAPTIQVKGNPTEYTDEDDITLEITSDDNNQSGVKQITLPDKKVISGDKATYKVNANGDYHFTLEDNVGNKKTYTVTVDKIMIPYKFYIYGKDGKPLKGAGYELYRDGNVHATAESDVNGLVDFGKVPPTGKYTLKQIYAPDGYIVDSEEKEVDVDDVTEPEEIISYPRGDELPSTGTYDYILGVIILFSLLLIGITLYNQHEED